ncbi:MAG: RIP metalloprotease RseP [bacterium]
MNIINSVWWLIVAIGILVTFHEFGHYWVARKMGVKVLRFSVGFGKVLISRKNKQGTEFALSAIPLGGYVKMLDERVEPVEDALKPESFNTKSVYARFAIVAAGPVFNLIMAVFMFWAMYIIGVQDIRPVIGKPELVAQKAGFHEGDKILSINNQPVTTWTHATIELIEASSQEKPISIQVEDTKGNSRELSIDHYSLPDDIDDSKVIEHLGLKPWQPSLPSEIGSLPEQSAARDAGLKPGDVIVKINQVTITDFTTLGKTIQTESKSGPIKLKVMRDSQELEITLIPKLVEQNGENRYVIGIYPPEPSEELKQQYERFVTLQRYGPIDALFQSFEETQRLGLATLNMIKRMVVGEASVKNLSGPIAIAQFASQSADSGTARFLFFLGLLSLSLAILNFLPIPMLDGGHLLYYLVEMVKGSPVSEQTQIIGQYIGIAALMMMMSVAFYNDIVRTLGS